MLPTATVAFDRPADGTAVLAVTGSMDVYSATGIRAALVDVANEGRYRQVVNLCEVTHIDSTGLGVIVGAVKRARAHGGNLVIVADPMGPVWRTLRITGVVKTISMASTVDEALQLVAPDPQRPVFAATTARDIALDLIRRAVADATGQITDEEIRTRIDSLVYSGQVPAAGYEALRDLADAVGEELGRAVDFDLITVAIADETP